MADNLPKIPTDGSNHGSELRFRDDTTSYTKRFRLTTGEENFVLDVPDASGKLVTTSNLQGVLEEFTALGGNIVKILKPDVTGYGILNPDGFNDVVQAAPYRTHPSFIGKHEYTEWQAATDDTFNNLVDSTVNPDYKNAWEPYVPLPDVRVYLRYRFGSGDIISPWSDTLEYTTPIAGVKKPTVDVVKGVRTTIDSIYNGTYGDIPGIEHSSTSYKVTNINTGVVALDIVKDPINKTKYIIEPGVLGLNESYKIEVTHHTNHAKYSRSPVVIAKTDTYGLSVEASPLVVQYKYDSDKCKSYIQASIFNVPGDTHRTTDWKIYRSVSGVEGEVLFQSTNDATNLYSLDVSSVMTEANTEYIVEVIQNGDNNNLKKKLPIKTPNVIIKPISLVVDTSSNNIRLKINNFGTSVSGVNVEDVLGVPEYVKFYITDSTNKTNHIVVDLRKENDLDPVVYGTKDEDILFNIDTTTTGWQINSIGFDSNIRLKKETFISILMNNLKTKILNLIHSDLDTTGNNNNAKVDEDFKIEAYVRFTKAKTNIASVNFNYNHKVVFTDPVITAIESNNASLRAEWGFAESLTKVINGKKVINPDNNLFVLLNKYKEVSSLGTDIRLEKLEYVATDVNKIIAPGQISNDKTISFNKYNVDFKRFTRATATEPDGIKTYYISSGTSGLDTRHCLVGKLGWDMNTDSYTPGSNSDRDFFLTGLQADKSAYIRNDIEGYCNIYTNIGIYRTNVKATWINDVKYSLNKPVLQEVNGGVKLTNKDHYNDIAAINAIVNAGAENADLYIDQYTGPAGIMWTIEDINHTIEPIQIYTPVTGTTGTNKQITDDDITVMINHPSLVADKTYLVRCRVYYSQSDVSGTGNVYYSSTREAILPYKYKDLTPKYTISGTLTEKRINKTITNLSNAITINSTSGIFLNNQHGMKVLFTIKKATDQQAITKMVINNPVANKIYTNGTKFNINFINIGLFKDFVFEHNMNYDINISMYLTTATDASTEIKPGDRLVSNVINTVFRFDKNKYKPRLTIDELDNPNSMGAPYTLGKFHGVIKLGEASNVNPYPTSNLDKTFIHPGFHLDDISKVPVYGERLYCGIWGNKNNFTIGKITLDSDSNQHMGYIKGNQVSYNGKLYEALIDQNWNEFEPGVVGNESKWVEVHEDIRLPNFPELIERLGIPTHLSNLPKLGVPVTYDRNYPAVNNIKNYASIQPDSYARNTSINKVKGSYYKITSPVTGKICYVTYMPIATNTSIQDLIQTHGELAELDMFTMRFGTGLYYVRIPTYEELDMIVRHETNGAFGGNNTGTGTALAGLKGSEFNTSEYAVTDRPEYTYVLNTFIDNNGVRKPEERLPRYQVYNFNMGRISQVLVGDTKGCIALVLTPMYPDEEPWNTSEITRKFPNAKLPTAGYVTPKLSKNNDANETTALLDYDKYTDTGYFGRVTSEQFHTYKEILNKYNFGGNIVKNLPGDGVSDKDVKMWDVFWYHGSIVYIPTSHPWDTQHKYLFDINKPGNTGNSSLIFNSNSGHTEYNRHKLEPNYINGMNGDNNYYKIGTLSSVNKMVIVENKVADPSQLTTEIIPQGKTGVLETTKLHTVKLSYDNSSLSKVKNRVNIVSDCMVTDLCYRLWLKYLKSETDPEITISDNDTTVMGPCIKGDHFVLPPVAQQDSNNNYYGYKSKILNSRDYLIRLITNPGESKYSVYNNVIGSNIRFGEIKGLINSKELATPINPVIILHSNAGMRQLDSSIPSLVPKNTLGKDFLLNIYNKLIGTTDPVTNRTITRKEIVGYYFKLELEKVLGLSNDLDTRVFNHQEQSIYTSDSVIANTSTKDTRLAVLDNINNTIKTEDLLYNYDYFYQLPPDAASPYYETNGKIRISDWSNKLVDANRTWLSVLELINGNGPDKLYYLKEINKLLVEEHLNYRDQNGDKVFDLSNGKIVRVKNTPVWYSYYTLFYKAGVNTIEYIKQFNIDNGTNYELVWGHFIPSPTQKVINDSQSKIPDIEMNIPPLSNIMYGGWFGINTIGIMVPHITYVSIGNFVQFEGSDNEAYKRQYNARWIDYIKTSIGGDHSLIHFNIEKVIKNHFITLQSNPIIRTKSIPNNTFNYPIPGGHYTIKGDSIFNKTLILELYNVCKNINSTGLNTSHISHMIETYRYISSQYEDYDYLNNSNNQAGNIFSMNNERVFVTDKNFKFNTSISPGIQYNHSYNIDVSLWLDYYIHVSHFYQLPPREAREYWVNGDYKQGVLIDKWVAKLKELGRNYALDEELGIIKTQTFLFPTNKYNIYTDPEYKKHHIILPETGDVEFSLNRDKWNDEVSEWIFDNKIVFLGISVVPLKDSYVTKYIKNNKLTSSNYEAMFKEIFSFYHLTQQDQNHWYQFLKNGWRPNLAYVNPENMTLPEDFIREWNNYNVYGYGKFIPGYGNAFLNSLKAIVPSGSFVYNGVADLDMTKYYKDIKTYKISDDVYLSGFKPTPETTTYEQLLNAICARRFTIPKNTFEKGRLYLIRFNFSTQWADYNNDSAKYYIKPINQYDIVYVP